MQAPPPVPNLLMRIATTATNVQNIAAQSGIDWQRRPQEGGWSITEVLCHLRDVEIEVHQKRFEAILGEENAFLPGVSADEWAQERQYQFQDGQLALGEFVSARQMTIGLLQGISDESWTRQGRHAFFGPTTMHEILFLLARHDDIHVEQLRTLVEQQQ